MDAIAHGWTYGREARSIQFVKFEQMLDRPLEEVRREYGLGRDCSGVSGLRLVQPPELLRTTTRAADTGGE
jgi:hypothetical protein